VTKQEWIEIACKGDKRIYKVRIDGMTYGLSRADLHFFAGQYDGSCRRHLRRIRHLLT
jgi:hypothetical protein